MKNEIQIYSDVENNLIKDVKKNPPPLNRHLLGFNSHIGTGECVNIIAVEILGEIVFLSYRDAVYAKNRANNVGKKEYGCDIEYYPITHWMYAPVLANKTL